MRLVDVDSHGDRYSLLWELLEEREPTANISHKKMPTMRQHKKFVDSNPYRAWYFIEGERYRCIVGACYLTKQNEIGIQLFKEYQGQGHGRQAVRVLMEMHGPRRYLANVNPLNERSGLMFRKLGFNVIQCTFAREP